MQLTVDDVAVVFLFSLPWAANMAFNLAAAAAAASLGVAGGVEGVGKGSEPWGGESGVSWSHLERFRFLVSLSTLFKV